MSDVNDWSAYDIEGTFSEVVNEMSRRNAKPTQRLRLHVEVIDEGEESPWPPDFFGAFESGESDVSSRAKEILRSELGQSKS
jgi:hypothetical protein